MTFNTYHEELPPDEIDSQTRQRVTGYDSAEFDVIDTGAIPIDSPTIEDLAKEREDNPYLRLIVIAGIFGFVILLFWSIFALISPKAPPPAAKESEEVEETVEEPEADYQAKLALRDQFHSLEKKQSVTPAVDNQVRESVAAEVSVTPKPVTSKPVVPVERTQPRPQPRPVAPRALSRPVPTVQIQPQPELDPHQQWLALANFGTGVSSRPTPVPNMTVAKQPTSQTLRTNRELSSGELGILNRQTQASFQPTPGVIIEPGIAKAKIELPLVWDSSLTPEAQQLPQITAILEEPFYERQGKVIFESGSRAVLQVQSINDSNGLVTAYVSQINDIRLEPEQLILRNQHKSALVAKASKRSDFGERLLVGGVDTLSNFGNQLLTPTSTSTVFNGSGIVTNQSRNSVGRDLAGSALDGFGSALSSELQQRHVRNQIGNGGTIYTLSQGETVYLTNIQPITINP